MSYQNIYSPKTLCGNWQEDRCTSQFDKDKAKEAPFLAPLSNYI